MATSLQSHRHHHQHPNQSTHDHLEDQHEVDHRIRSIDELDDISSPDQEWVIFNPPSTHMPNHDGSGRFSADLDDEFEGSIRRSTARSLTSDDLRINSPLDSWDDDLLSIPSSLSHDQSNDSNGHSSSQPHSRPIEPDEDLTSLDPDGPGLLINPHPLSAGLPSSAQSHQLTHNPLVTSSVEPIQRGRSWGRTHSNRSSHRTHSRRTSSVSLQRSSSRKPSQARLPTVSDEDETILSIPIRAEQIAIRFLTRMATRIMSVDSDTMTLVTDAEIPQIRTIRRSEISRTHQQNRIHQRNQKFTSIGDGDPGLSSDEISSPLDLSPFSGMNHKTHINHTHLKTHPIDPSEPDDLNHHHWTQVLSDWTNW